MLAPSRGSTPRFQRSCRRSERGGGSGQFNESVNLVQNFPLNARRRSAGRPTKVPSLQDRGPISHPTTRRRCPPNPVSSTPRVCRSRLSCIPPEGPSLCVKCCLTQQVDRRDDIAVLGSPVGRQASSVTLLQLSFAPARPPQPARDHPVTFKLPGFDFGPRMVRLRSWQHSVHRPGY